MPHSLRFQSGVVFRRMLLQLPQIVLFSLFCYPTQPRMRDIHWDNYDLLGLGRPLCPASIEHDA